MSADLHERLDAFLARHTTLALATQGEDGPWVAPLFYAHDERLTLYFLSSPTSRHSCELVYNSVVAATIYADGQAWREIQGVQLEGVAAEAPEETLAGAARVYVAKFPFVASWFLGEEGAPPELTGPLAGSRFYQIRPRWLRLVDNTRGFGHKEVLELDPRFPYEDLHD